MEKDKEVYYEFENNWNLVTITDSLLIADPKKYAYKVNLHKITKIHFYDDSDPARTALLSGMAGFLLGFTISGQSFDLGGGGSYSFSRATRGAFLGAAIFAVIGGAISMALRDFESFDVSVESDGSKRKKIVEILRRNKLKK